MFKKMLVRNIILLEEINELGEKHLETRITVILKTVKALAQKSVFAIGGYNGAYLLKIQPVQKNKCSLCLPSFLKV